MADPKMNTEQAPNFEELPLVAVDFEDAKTLADFAAIFQDLSFTIDVLKRLHTLLSEESQDHVMLRVLWSQALISYIRCFTPGVRFRITAEEVYAPRQDAVELHTHYKNLRDKHIAHSVNPFEQVTVGVYVGAEEVSGIGTFTMSMISTEADDINQFIALATFALKYVGHKAKVLQGRALEFARTLPIDSLRQLPPIRLNAPGPDQAGRARQS